MITKEITKMMIRDLSEELNNLKNKKQKYELLNLDHWIVADFNRAIETLDASIDQLLNDLTNFECDEDEEL
jgi:hypothetical protein